MATTSAHQAAKPAKAEVVMYAEEGCPQLDKPWINGKPQTATMLFADIERKKWRCTAAYAIEEGGLVESIDSRPNMRVTWVTVADLAALSKKAA